MATALSETLSTLKECLCDCLEECGFDVPECVYVSLGPPPLDCCDVLAVYAQNAVPQPGNQCVSMVDIVLKAQYWFCVPIPELGPGTSSQLVENYEEIEDLALSHADIAFSLGADGANCLALEDGDTCANEIESTWLMIPPQGGCAGIEFSWTIKGVIQ